MSTSKAKLACLRWRIRLRSWWQPIYWTCLAVCLWPVAYFLPQYLLHSGHHPPVGTYIAIAGLLAASVTLRKDPPLKEKACWILLITLVTVAEIRNLYIADREQSETFGKIRDDLGHTKEGLDQTVTNLGIVEEKLRGVSEHVDTGILSSQRAADTAAETLKTITGAGPIAIWI